MMKEVEGQSKFWQLANRLGYQMAGIVGQSIGDNWAAGSGLLSKLTLGIGPLNLTLGKGQKLLQWQNNLGNIITNMVGITNLAFGGKVRFDWANLSPIYYGGIKDRIFGTKTGYGAHAIFGCDKKMIH